MKKFILAASALISAAALTSTANAADMTPVPSAYDWSGFYFGANAGVAWNNSNLENDLEYTGGTNVLGFTPGEINNFLDDIEGDSVGGDDATFTGGALIGYNWQMESLVLGLEADFNYAGFGDDNKEDVIDAVSQFLQSADEASLESSFDANWFGTLRGRIGFAADNLLFYGTGGLAYGNMEADVHLRVTDSDETYSYSGSTETTNWGWTVGAGFEYGIDNWSLGAEYLFVDLGSAEWDGDWNSTDTNELDPADGFEGDGHIDYQFSVVRATAKIRF